MNTVAPGVWHIPLAPRSSVNAYLLDDVLVDAGIAMMGKRLPGKLAGRRVSAHVLTHAHPDHAGGSKAVVEALGIPFWVPAGDVQAIEQGHTVAGPGPLKRVLEKTGPIPRVPIARRLTEGDEVAGFTVLDTPGHSPGHVSFWRERDRVLICGDVWFNMNLLKLKPELRAPLRLPTVDPARNVESQRRLLELQPEVVCFGHGPVMTGAASKLRVFPA